MKKQILWYEIGKWTIMEVQYDDTFEYYVRETVNQYDYFRFVFGSMSRFNEENLTALVDSDYFREVD